MYLSDVCGSDDDVVVDGLEGVNSGKLFRRQRNDHRIDVTPVTGDALKNSVFAFARRDTIMLHDMMRKTRKTIKTRKTSSIISERQILKQAIIIQNRQRANNAKMIKVILRTTDLINILQH